ncbi:MAG: hypothetical protein ACOVRN_19180 [Flavobacterium sp.]
MTYEDAHVSESESENEIDNVIDTESVVDSVADSNASVKRISKRQAEKEIRSSDPDYYVTTRGFGKKMKEIAMYSTNCTPGRLIRDPVFGTRYKDRVGSLAERNYFRVRMTTIGDGTVPVTLYYDCPEAYEKHMRTTVSYELKKEWRARNNI